MNNSHSSDEHAASCSDGPFISMTEIQTYTRGSSFQWKYYCFASERWSLRMPTLFILFFSCCFLYHREFATLFRVSPWQAFCWWWMRCEVHGAKLPGILVPVAVGTTEPRFSAGLLRLPPVYSWHSCLTSGCLIPSHTLINRGHKNICLVGKYKGWEPCLEHI